MAERFGVETVREMGDEEEDLTEDVTLPFRE